MTAGTDATAPASSVPWRDGLLGLSGLLAGWLTVMLLRPHPLVGVWLVLLCVSLPMLAAELQRAGAAQRREPGRAIAAFIIGLPLAGLPFFLFHLQAAGLGPWIVAWVAAAPALLIRFVLEWARTGAVSGGFPVRLGQMLLGREAADWRRLAAPARLFALKAIFIPLYAASLLALVSAALGSHPSSLLDWLTLAVVLAYTIDLGFGLSGYVFAANELVPTVRSTQPRLIGWVVCLACYGPVFAHWPAFEAVVRAEIGWPKTLDLTLVSGLGAVAMLALLVLYVSASVCFGLRFSNLANRGVLTAGPYRLMKHPAYFAHAANAWVLCLVLLPAAGTDLGPTGFLVPLAFSAFYWARARTEELHMREDPDYVAYERWIAAHGLVARLRRAVLRA